jgi:hypothetical protein
MRSSAAPPASADCSTYSPVSRGLRPSSRVFTRGCLPRFVLSGAARRASLGVSCPSAHPRPAGPLPRGFHTPLRSGLRVSTLSPASSPRALPALFHAGALLGFALQGLDPPGPSAPLTRPVTPATLAARRLRTSRRSESRLVVRAARKPVLGASRPRSPNPPAGCSPDAVGLAPLLGFILPEALPPPAAPPRPGGHPPLGFRATFGLAPRDRPDPPGSSTASGLARLLEPSSLSEVPSPF